MTQVGDLGAESNPEPMAHLAQPLRSSARGRRVARTTQRGVRRISAVAMVLVLLGGGFLWLRDSDLVAVRDVTVTGVSSNQETRVREALRRAGLGMTTLHVRRDELRAAASPYASVADLRAEPDFPDKLRIEVVERVPAALLVAGDQEVAVSTGGLLLRGVRPDDGTPVIAVRQLPIGARLDDPRVRSAVAVLAGAPPELRERIEEAGTGTRGTQLELRDGPDLIFGSPSRLEAKWMAATRVLADSSAKGATYLDLRMPEWTAAGGIGPVESATEAPPGDDTTASETPPADPQP